MLDDFHDVSFPLRIALGSRGGPERRTDIVSLVSGHERRISRWQQSRRRFQVGSAVSCRNDVADVIAFFEARQGRRYAFRFRDPFDHQTATNASDVGAADIVIGSGDGSSTEFRLLKTYGSGPYTVSRGIVLPDPASVRVAIDGVEQTVGVDVTLEVPGGILRFATAPASGAVITAGCIFDLPARFDTDGLVLEAEAGGANVPDIPIVEVRV